MLPLVFLDLFPRVIEVLRVTLLQAWSRNLMEVDESGIVLTREFESSSGITTIRD